MTLDDAGWTACDRPQPQCTRRVTGEFNNDNLLERVVSWYADPVLGEE